MQVKNQSEWEKIREEDIVIVHAVQVVVRVIDDNKRGRARAIRKYEDFNDMVEYAQDISKKDAKIYLRLHDDHQIITNQREWSRVGHHSSILITDNPPVWKEHNVRWFVHHWQPSLPDSSS